jgi:2-iminobutanoate/2-iminopropanoate deaminase
MKKQIVLDANEDYPSYSPGIEAGSFLFVSGQGPLDKENNIVGNTIEEQTIAAMNNVFEIIEKSGGTKEDIVKVNVFLDPIELFNRFDAQYQKIMPKIKPARTTVGSKLSLPGMMIEVDCIAYIKK